MREFYEDKLNEMSTLLAEKETESETLSEELKKLDKNHSGGKELAERLRQKQEQVAGLKKKQAELTRLTAVASRNESQISRLCNDVSEMKQKKVDLQKQITSERKTHFLEVQKLKKESMQKDRELNKVKNISDKKALEAHKAQQVAKSRLEQMNRLKTKYIEADKRLRMQTMKRGVMRKAGLDPVMVGRRQSKTKAADKNNKTSREVKDDAINFDNLRDFFDQKVADVGRREALAEKLAQEWEDHLELSIQRDELLTQDAGGDPSDALESLDSQIKYKEDRIRQFASRLGKRQKELDEKKSQEEEPFLFDQGFTKIIGSKLQCFFLDRGYLNNNLTLLFLFIQRLRP
jgi:myosin heavy subunit